MAGKLVSVSLLLQWHLGVNFLATVEVSCGSCLQSFLVGNLLFGSVLASGQLEYGPHWQLRLSKQFLIFYSGPPRLVSAAPCKEHMIYLAPCKKLSKS